MERPLNATEQAIALMEPSVDLLGRATNSLGEAATVSIAISLKRIADAMGEGSPFLSSLFGTLDDVSHNHQQRMRNI